ncbi:MAG: hypothetical protein JXQ90_13465 [Cyclobacteriaceae bacterium]
MRRLGILSIFMILLSACDVGLGEDGFESFGPDGGVSQGGSLSRFTIIDDYLYVVNDYSLIPIDIRDLSRPIAHDSIVLDIGIETIFPYGEYLFIGSTSAVFIYDIQDPLKPQWLSTYQHATGCDPVVVKDNIAYVTLREGFSCGNPFAINVLEVVNVENKRQPYQVNQIGMTNPRGLGVGCNNKLFVCEGKSGLVQFNIENPNDPIRELTYDDRPANDVIVKEGLVIVTGEDGVYQYDCSADTLELLSFIPLSL